MDLLAACEDLAANVAAFDVTEDDLYVYVSEDDLEMWQMLFGFSSSLAFNTIKAWRADFTRLAISEEAWLLVREAKMAEGYNKESYEFSLWRAQMILKDSRTSINNSEAKDEEAKYLLQLKTDPTSMTEYLDLMRCLPKEHTILTGLDDYGNKAEFCLLTGSQKVEFLQAMSKKRPFYKPTMIRTSVAAKDLSLTSLYPTLGISTTFPQFRPDNHHLECASTSDSTSLFRPAQNEYPVWYFFYGTLTDPSKLSRVIGLNKEHPVVYERATIRRGRLCTLDGKYLSLVDAGEHSKVDGWAYQIKNQDEEDSLRVYETGVYEVVRCTIELANKPDAKVQGLTFRLVDGLFGPD
ncbi:hypothetical protein TGAMA5MH_10438 [Trichoderma gamsii]|uniref:Putative gamma-glutamylcyclotransferase n=1 Tax=Trichoderma gamsii TaxID=398673 RepID=A0A2K0SWK6_9HYPO|nr:hypothetical protein TGAMA5MH_10438 [Trichoderma gamsii]